MFAQSPSALFFAAEIARSLAPQIQEQLVQIQRSPKLVRSFFLHPDVSYIYD
jgi:hypothetical protein